MIECESELASRYFHEQMWKPTLCNVQVCRDYTTYAGNRMIKDLQETNER